MSVNIPRTFVFSDGFTYSANAIESELSNIIQTINNANSGLLTWDNVKATTATLTTAAITTPTISGTTTLSALTASRALTLNASKAIAVSATTDTELAFVSGVTSAIQTQLTGKLATDLSNIGTVANDVAMNSHKFTGLSAGSAAGHSVRFEQLKYIQTVQATSSTNTATTSSTFAAATNMTVTITPTSASNRVKVTVQTVMNTTNGGLTNVAITLKRGTTELSGVAAGFALSTITGTSSGHISYIDSPATTGATTYQVFVRSADNTTSVSVGNASVLSVMIAEEII